MFAVSSGYRKIPTDTCVNDLDIYKPSLYSCNKTLYLNVPLSGTQAATLAICSVIAIVIIVLIIYATRKGYISEFVKNICKKKKWRPNLGYAVHINEDEEELAKSGESPNGKGNGQAKRNNDDEDLIRLDTES